jgi:hypothetical protein
MKSRKMIWVGAYTTRGRLKMNTEFWSGNLNGRDHFEDLDIDGREVLEWFLKKQNGNVWAGFFCCEHDSELSNSVKGGQFLG